MLWDEPVVQDFREHLARVGTEDGVTRCAVCHSESVGISRAPVLLAWRGSPWVEPGEPGHDSQANILYMFSVECGFCGYTMLFNSERVDRPDRPTLRPE
jgi:hypothetical protein